MTLYIRIEPEVSYQRQKMRNAPKDYFESKDEKFYQKLVKGYDMAAEIFKDRIKVIDGHGGQDEVFTGIKVHLDGLIQRRS